LPQFYKNYSNFKLWNKITNALPYLSYKPLTIKNIFDILITVIQHKSCALGGIGRRAWFRSMCQQWLGSSNLPGRTKSTAIYYSCAFLFKIKEL